MPVSACLDAALDVPGAPGVADHLVLAVVDPKLVPDKELGVSLGHVEYLHQLELVVLPGVVEAHDGLLVLGDGLDLLYGARERAVSVGHQAGHGVTPGAHQGGGGGHHPAAYLTRHVAVHYAVCLALHGAAHSSSHVLVLEPESNFGQM